MEYREHEIYARVCGTYSDLYSLLPDGELDKSEDIIIYNDDEQIVWYEVEVIDPDVGYTITHTQLDSIEAAKRLIDRSIDWCKKNIKGYGEDN